MMDTILNLGLNDVTVDALARNTGNPRFAYDCYRRLIQMFGNVVLDIDGYHFEKQLHHFKQLHDYNEDKDIPAEAWMELIAQYKDLIERKARTTFPQDVYKQLELSIEAVFRSWNNQRAVVYRKVYGIPDTLGTAVNIQSMVFGNRGEDCGTGVLFTRNPSTGDNLLYGEYLTNAQGEDVVAGVRTPSPIAQLEQEMPEVYTRLVEIANRLEMHYKDLQDIEFTVEKESCSFSRLVLEKERHRQLSNWRCNSLKMAFLIASRLWSGLKWIISINCFTAQSTRVRSWTYWRLVCRLHQERQRGRLYSTPIRLKNGSQPASVLYWSAQRQVRKIFTVSLQPKVCLRPEGDDEPCCGSGTRNGQALCMRL